MTDLESSSPSRGRRLVLAMVLLNAFSTPLMLSAVNVALPSIARDLGLSAVALSWVPMAYLMASAMSILVFGGLADRFGHKRVFLAGNVAVILTSCLAALSADGTQLLAARFLQGVGAAALYATQMAIVASVFPGAGRGRVIGLVIATVYAGLASGPLLGGLVVDAVGWRGSFLMHLPLASVVLFIGLAKVKTDWSLEFPGRFDRVGAAVYMTAIFLFCFGVSRLPRIDGYILLAAGIFAGALFVRHARRIPNPLWDINLFFRNRVFALSCLASLLMYSATYANVVLVSLYFQYLRGETAATAGLFMMVQTLAMTALSPWAGRLSDRVEPRVLASAGMAVTMAGLAFLAYLDEASAWGWPVIALVLVGSGFSLFSSPNSNAIMGSVARQNYGSASSALATTRILGQLNSMVLVTLVMTLVMGSAAIGEANLPSLSQAIDTSFLVAALMCLPGIAASLLRGRFHGAGSGT